MTDEETVKGDKGEGSEEIKDSKILDAMDMIAEMASSGKLVPVPLDYDQRISLDPEEHPELDNESMGSPVVIVLGGIVTGLPKPDKEATDGNMPTMPGNSKVECTMYEVAVVHGNVSDTIAKMMREKKAGTGPHMGKHGPLVKSNKQIQAIAYRKEGGGKE